MTRRLGLVLAVLLVAAGGVFGATVAGQESGVQKPASRVVAACPAGLVCVDYQGATLEVDPNCGPVIAFAVSESLARTVDLSGTTESYGIGGVVLIAVGDTYEVAGEFSGPATGPLRDVRFGDTACLTWSSGDV